MFWLGFIAGIYTLAVAEFAFLIIKAVKKQDEGENDK